MTNAAATYRITHDAISPTPDVMTADELRDYLTHLADDDAYAETPENPDPSMWRLPLNTLDIRDDGIYADTGDRRGVVMIAEPIA